MARRDSILVSRTLYQIGIVTLMAAIMWVAIGVYSASVKPLSVNVEKALLEPITTTIDPEVVTAIINRVKVENKIATESATIEEAGVR